MAEEFRIDVVVDPGDAEAGIAKVGQSLGRAEQSAAELSRELTKALSARDAGLTATLTKLDKTLDSIGRKVDNVGDELDKPRDDPFTKQLQSIRAQNEALQIRNRTQGAQAQFLQVEAQLRAQNRTLTEAEVRALKQAIGQQRTLNQSIQQQAATKNAVAASEARIREAQIRALRISKSRRDALLEANRLRAQGVQLTAQQVNALEKQFARERRITSELRKQDVAQEKVNASTSRFGSLAKTAFAGVGIALVTRKLIGLSDAYTQITNKIATVVQGQDAVAGSFDRLLDISTRTRTDLAALTQVYQRGSLAAENLGISQNELFKFTERIGKALAVQGTSAEAARGALLQLSQALGSGIVRGEEFNSILEGALPIAQAAARGITRFGGDVTKLRTAIIKGQVTSKEFFEGIQRGSDQIEKQFEQTTPTIGQAFTVLNNKLIASVGAFNEATGASEGFAELIIALGENIEAISIAIGALATGLGVKYAVNAVPKAIAATKALTVAQGALAASVVAAGAALVVLGNRIQKYNEDIRAIGETLDMVAGDAELISSSAAQLTAAQRELNRLTRLTTTGIRGQNGELLIQAELSESQQKRVEQLRQTIARLRGDLRQEAVARKEVAAAAAEQKAAEDERAASLKRQEELLAALEKPEKDRLQRIEDLRALLARGVGDAKLLSEELARLQQEATGRPARAEKDPFAEGVASLEKQNEQLRIRANNFGLQREGLLLELQLFGQLLDKNDERRGQLASLLLAQKELTAELRTQKAVQDTLDSAALRTRELEIEARGLSEARTEALITQLRLRQQGIEFGDEEVSKLERELDKQKQITAEIEQRKDLDALARELDVNAQIEEQRTRLLALRERETELIPEIDRALEDLRLRELEAAENLGAGFERAFIKIRREANDLAAVGEKIVNIFADQATAAITEFVETGRFSFKEFASAVIKDIQRIIIRLLVLKAIESIGGGLGGLAGGAGGGGLGAGRQEGGTVQPGQAAFPVGENGPELFVPNRTGTIVPNAADMKQEPPVVNVQLVTVQNEDMVAEAIASGSADEAIVQRIGANRDRVDAAQG